MSRHWLLGMWLLRKFIVSAWHKYVVVYLYSGKPGLRWTTTIAPKWDGLHHAARWVTKTKARDTTKHTWRYPIRDNTVLATCFLRNCTLHVHLSLVWLNKYTRAFYIHILIRMRRCSIVRYKTTSPPTSPSPLPPPIPLPWFVVFPPGSWTFSCVFFERIVVKMTI